MATATIEKRPADQTLATWREVMGYSQRDAAEQLGCARASVQKWEHQPEHTPKYIRLAMAALALGIKVDGRSNDEGSTDSD